MTIGDRIKKRREELSMSQEELALKCGYKSRSSINKIEKDGRELPSRKISVIAKVLRTSPAYLMGWLDEENSQNIPIPKKGVKIKILGKVKAGIPVEAIEDIIGEEEITEEMSNTGEFFGLKIDGDSMFPRIENGDIVIVKKQEYIDSGDIAIILVNGNDATCKKIKKYKNGIMLIPLNSSYEPLFFTNEEIEQLPVHIIGKVVELRAKF